MIVTLAYRSDLTVNVCRDHYHGRKPLPVDAPPLGAVQDARDESGCDYCEREAATFHLSDTAQRSGPWARRSRD